MPRLPPVIKSTWSKSHLLHRSRASVKTVRTDYIIEETPVSRTIDYYFTPQSPWTYLGHARFAAIAQAAGATVRVRPIDFGAVFPVSGGLPLGKRAPQRQAYRLVDLARFSRHLDMPLNPKPKFFPGGRRRRRQAHHRGRPARRHRGRDEARAARCSRPCGCRSATSPTRRCSRRWSPNAGCRRARVDAVAKPGACRSATRTTRSRRSTPACSARRAT